MATKAKAKPAAKKPAAKKTTKKPAAKATKQKAPAKKPEVKLMEVGDFAIFTGYKTELDAEDAVFSEGDQIYIADVIEDEESGTISYIAVVAGDVGELLENGDENVTGGEVAASEIRALKGNALDKVREQYMPVRVMGDLVSLLEEADGDAIEVAQELNADIAKAYFYMGGALAMVLQNGSHLKENGGSYEGDDAFNEFCQNEFNFKASKGRALARIYTTFSALPGFDPDELMGLKGWSIASKIEKYVTPDNYKDVLDAASGDNVTQRNVDALMKEQFVEESGRTSSGRQASRGGERLSIKVMTFKLVEESAAAVELALNAAKKQYGLESDEEAIERIFVEWAQEFVETVTNKKSIAAKARKGAKAREAAASK